MSSPRAGARSPTVEAAAVAMTALAATPVVGHRRRPSRSTTAVVAAAAKAMPGGYGEEESKGMEPEDHQMPTHRRQQEQQQVEQQQLAPSGSFALASASASASPRLQRRCTLTGRAKAALAVEGELRELLGPKGMASGEEEEGVEDNSEEDGKKGKGKPKGKGAKKPAAGGAAGGQKKAKGKGAAQGGEEEELIVRLPYPAGQLGKQPRGKGKRQGKAPPMPTAGVNRNGDPKKRYNWTKEEDAALRALVRRGVAVRVVWLVGRGGAVTLDVYICSLTRSI